MLIIHRIRIASSGEEGEMVDDANEVTHFLKREGDGGLNNGPEGDPNEDGNMGAYVRELNLLT